MNRKSSIIKTILLFIISLSYYNIQAQNITNDKYKLELDLGFGTYYQFSRFGVTKINKVKIPRLLPRRIANLAIRNNWGLANDNITDNPFFHGSYFFQFGGNFEFDESLSVTASINMEQRGFSDGKFSKNTFNVYPYFNAHYAKSKGKFSSLLQVGDFNNLKLYEGLTYYNLETQSWVFKLKYDKFYVKHVGIGDLFKSIGLGIDDLYDYSFGVEKLQLLKDDSLSLDIRLGFSNNRRSSGGFRNLSFHLGYRKTANAYVQVSSKNTGGSAFLAGVNYYKKIADNLTFESTIEYRNYSADFNRGFKNSVEYRDPTKSATFLNSIGNAFFPLETYEKDFSQWAVFTEYQDRDITGLNIRAKLLGRIVSKTYFKIEVDLNWLNTKQELFSYPFYKLGIGIKPNENIDLFLEITNKVLNLDKHFPTIYATTSPYYLIHAYKPLRFIKKNDELHRLW